MKKIIYILISFFIFAFCLLQLNAQWVQQPSGVTTPLYNVEFVNRFTGWVTGNSSVILKTTNGGVNWFQQTIDLGYPKNLYGLDMLDESTGYIAGWFETILKTTNGGNNWLIISNIPANDGNSNHAVSFINSQTGWVCSSLGRVLRTTNGGISWDTASTGTGGPLRDIQFLNPQTGWACGDGGTLIKSTNGGINWTVVPNLSGANIPALHFININTGWAVTEQSNYVYKTTNSGINWDTAAVLPGGNNQYSYTIFFANAQTGWVGGTYGRIFRTNNGGNNWFNEDYDLAGFVSNFSSYEDSLIWCIGGGGKIKRRNVFNTEIVSSGWFEQSNNSPSQHRDLFMFDSTTGWIVGVNDTIYHTTNSGLNWSGISTGGYYGLWSVFFVNNVTGWAVGKQGLILKTTNSGGNWVSQSIPIWDWFFSVYFVSENEGWAVGGQGRIIHTTNSGQNWNWQNAPWSSDYYSVTFSSNTKGWISGANGRIFVTTNAGTNWVQQMSPTVSPLFDIFFLNDSLGFCTGGNLDGIVLKTINGGDNWTTIYLGSQKLNSLYFITKDTGWVTGDSGIVLFTTNSGANWETQNTGNYNNLYSIRFVNPKLGWIVGGYGTILKTTSCGKPIGIGSNQNSLPNKYSLEQNYPNPFNPSTEIRYSIPSGGLVTLKVYNLLGEEIAILVGEYKEAGEYSVIFDGSNLSSGVYFYKLEIGVYAAAKKMVLVK